MKKAVAVATGLLFFHLLFARKTQKPPLHAKHWRAVTGKPPAAIAGTKVFERGSNAVDAACGKPAAMRRYDGTHIGK